MLQEQAAKAVEIMKKGGLILYPTDTVWGIGCDATHAGAVERIYRFKRSADKKSMLVLVDSIDNVARYVGRVPSVAWDLFETADRPLTLILPGAHGIADNLVPEEGTLGIRVPQHDFCREMLRRMGRPVVSTSANISGEPAPAWFGDISEEIKGGVDWIVDPEYEKGATGRPSSIIMLGAGGEVKIIRR